jgi:SNF2 family DNA or RNA helicase/DNA uptake protein ComE-like DNA-binding protein
MSTEEIVQALKPMFAESSLKTLEMVAVAAKSVGDAINMMIRQTQIQEKVQKERNPYIRQTQIQEKVQKERNPYVDRRLHREAEHHRWLNKQTAAQHQTTNSGKRSRLESVGTKANAKPKGKLKRRQAWESDSDVENSVSESDGRGSGGSSSEDSDDDGRGGGRGNYNVRKVKDHDAAVVWFNTADSGSLQTLKGCSETKAKIIIRLRPFEDFDELLERLDSAAKVSSDLVTAYVEMLEVKRAVGDVLQGCLNISKKIKEQNLLANAKRMEHRTPASIAPGMKLRDFQFAGLRWLEKMDDQNLNMILADEMGLGKTIQSIAFLAHLFSKKGNRGFFGIIVPSSVLDNWSNELVKWCPAMKVCYLHGSVAERDQLLYELRHSDHGYNIILSTYNTACGAGRKAFQKPLMQFDCVIFDEGHMLKSLKTQRYATLSQISSKRRLLLTGTPLQNNLLELISLLSFTMPRLFSGDEGAVANHLNKFFSAASGKLEEEQHKMMIAQARGIMDPFVLRRKKADVLTDLPAKHTVVNYCELEGTQFKSYAALVKEFASRALERKEERVRQKIAERSGESAAAAVVTGSRAAKEKAASTSFKEVSDRDYFKQLDNEEGGKGKKRKLHRQGEVESSDEDEDGGGGGNSATPIELDLDVEIAVVKPALAVAASHWACGVCTLQNSARASVCKVCDAPKPADGGAAAAGWFTNGTSGGGGASSTGASPALGITDGEGAGSTSPPDTDKVQNTKGLENVMMQLRKLVNHPLLHRVRYNDSTLHQMTGAIMTEPQYHDASKQFIFEDMEVMNDFELDRMCHEFRSLKRWQLGAGMLEDSAKLRQLGPLLKTKQENGDRVLLFSQFKVMLDILEVWLTKIGYTFLRIDGSTSVTERQKLIDKYTGDPSILVFLLSTRAGGVGINLTAANTVVLHDIDYNPQQDRQAEARCHRVGQTKEVTIHRLIAKDTVEELMLDMANHKLKLDDDMSTGDSAISKDEIFDMLQKNAALFLQKEMGTKAPPAALKGRAKEAAGGGRGGSAGE